MKLALREFTAWVAKWSTARALRARQNLFVGSNPTSCKTIISTQQNQNFTY